MPNVTEIILDGQTVFYVEKGQKLLAHHLSAGHKSILAMIGDMVIRLMAQQPEVSEPQALQGLVIIDELEIHLHPKWQAQYARLLSMAFPRVQFIASSHSPIPFIGAPLESIFLRVTRDKERGTKVERLDIDVTRLLPNTLLTSPLFGMEGIVNFNNSDFGKVYSEDRHTEIVLKEQRREQLKAFAEKGLIPAAYLKMDRG